MRLGIRRPRRWVIVMVALIVCSVVGWHLRYGSDTVALDGGPIRMVLDGHGVDVVRVDSGSSAGYLRFGHTDEQTVIRVMEKALGDQPSKISLPECYGGDGMDLRGEQGSTVLIDDDGTMTGWEQWGPPPPSVTTASGITMGTSLDELRARYGSRLQVTVSYANATAEVPGGIRAQLKGTTGSSLVTSLDAGVECGV